MMTKRPYTESVNRLREAKLRPTRQRLALAKLLYNGGDRHVTAEKLHEEAMRSKVRVSLATVYNTLHQFCESGLLREVMVEPGRSYFDTNTSEHYHFLHEETGVLHDIPADALRFESLPVAPAGAEIGRVDVIIRLRRSS